MVDAALRQFGRLDCLDNNVGIGGRGSVVDVAPQDWRRVMQVNVDSMFMASRYAIPAMKETAGGGAIVNVSSISALRPRGLTAYSTSKGAVISLTRAMAVDHGPDGIRVNCVAPGPVYTPMVYSRQMSSAGREARRKASVLGIEGTGWDIGHAVRFLLSAEARYITGQTLVVDGGGHSTMARLPYLDKSDLLPEHQDLLARNLNLYRVLAHSPRAARSLNTLARFIRDGSRLDPRLRELAILQVSFLTRSAWGFSHHVRISREVGVSDEEIRAVADETAGRPTTLEPLAKAVLRAAREMTRDLAVSDETFATLRQDLDNERLTDLVVTISFYNGLVRLLESMQVDVEEDYLPYLEEFPLPKR
jgi:alkylhydroperoxidase family enzyme/enoyl-[acyl-carrier-protein] reductase (NADH)